MHIARIMLTHFRNHAATSVEAGSGLVILAGSNGAGKTNILEAISLLAPGRGLRGAALSEMIASAGGKGFTVSAALASAAAQFPDVAIGTAVDGATSGRRRVRVNGVDTAASALAQWVSLLWLTPAMDRLFIESAGGRRRFLDRLTLALSPQHAHHSSRYEAAMRSRNRLLSGDGPVDLHWLDALEAQMAEHGSAIDAARHGLVMRLSHTLLRAPAPSFAKAEIALGDSDGALATRWDAEALCHSLATSRKRDAAAGRALAGPHRTDMVALHAESGQPAGRCSTGEQKAMLLSIILAHSDLVALERGVRPILLLDELAAHLDPERRAALFARLTEAGGQVWMTGTEMALFDSVGREATRCLVHDGVAILPH